MRNAVVLLFARTIVALVGVSAVAAEEVQVEAAAVEDTFVGARKSSPPPNSKALPADVIALRPPGLCFIRWCGSTRVRSTCPYYYEWYGAKTYRLWAVLPDGGRVVGRCARVPWCRTCYRCVARKTALCVKELPFFTKWWFCRKGASGQLTPVLKGLTSVTPAKA